MSLQPYLHLLLLVLVMFFGIWLAKRSPSTPETGEAISMSPQTQEKGEHYPSILSGSERTKLSEHDRLLSLTNPEKFYTDLASHFLSRDPTTFTPIQQKVHTCQKIFSQIDNGGVSTMLYNADDRSQWCAQVASYCRELQAFTSAEAFESLSAIFAEMEARDLSHVKTWGDYLATAKEIGPLDELMDEMDPYGDLMTPLIDFVYEHREALLTEEAHPEAAGLPPLN